MDKVYKSALNEKLLRNAVRRVIVEHDMHLAPAPKFGHPRINVERNPDLLPGEAGGQPMTPEQLIDRIKDLLSDYQASQDRQLDGTISDEPVI